MSSDVRVAYLSMEIALEPAIPTYSGGLGVLAGDTIRSAADAGLRMAAVTLIHRSGYFDQILDEAGHQSERPVQWNVDDLVEPLEPRVEVEIEGRTVRLRAWRYRVRGELGAEVPVYLLDADLPENAPDDRRLTDHLYGGDQRYRLAQEVILGMGAVRMLRALGHESIARFHLNEGHAALAALALLEESFGSGDPSREEFTQAVRQLRGRCVFTTHTPVPAGHDRFTPGLARAVVGDRYGSWLERLGQRNELNMTDLGFRCSHFVNGVAMRHGEVSRGMFPDYPIRSITNGIHPATWASRSFRALFDRHIPEWRIDPLSLRYAMGIPPEDIWWAHVHAKRRLLEHVGRTTRSSLRENVFTIGFARRATPYKRATLVFHDLERLGAIAEQAGSFQILFAGKAHPHDQNGKRLIEEIFRARDALQGRVSVVYLPNYDMSMARLLVAGCDLWLNTPVPPQEASGTSGMKAALNGVPSLSIMDGWWVEGRVESVTGWSIGSDGERRARGDESLDAEHASLLYEKLRNHVLPCFYKRRERYQWMMQQAIALNASFFNTHRMLLQYLHNAYTDPPSSEG